MDASEGLVLPGESGGARDDAAHAVPGAPARTRIAVWDLPLRVAHWLLAAAVSTAIVSGKLGGEWMPLHGKAGLATVGLVAFRLVWGFLGGTQARFARFVRGPRAIVAYVRGRRHGGIGHNPLGALSVLALLGVLVVQATSGLFSNDDIAFAGPWFAHVSDETGAWATALHRRCSNWVLYLTGLHLAAIGFYLIVKRDNLIKPMWSGMKEIDSGGADEPPVRAGRRALAIATIVASAVLLLAAGLFPPT